MSQVPESLVARRRSELLAVFAGGVAGTLVRAAVEAAAAPSDGAFPWTTLTVNLAGAFLLGAVANGFGETVIDEGYRHPLLGAGFCGALTTFSTLQVELVRLVDDGAPATAASYAAASVVLGIGAAALGARLRRGSTDAESEKA